MARAPSPAGRPCVPSAASISDFLRHRAEETPEALAFRFLKDGETDEVEVTYSELRRDALAVAAGLIDRKLGSEPVLITAPPGPAFMASLFGAWNAGAIAVPAYPAKGSRHRARLEAIRKDCGAVVCLGEVPTRELAGLTFLDPSEMASDEIEFEPAANDGLPCLLQYTSGSTASPKGVVLRHGTLMGHLERIHEALEPRELDSILSWLPPYHDMGLVLKLLYSLRAGTPLTWMAPDHFVQKPARWLQAISRYRANMSGGPNFALEWCLRSVSDEDLSSLDLSCWTLAPIGAERVRRDTLERFAERFEPCGFDPRALSPGYGLAEATLVVNSHVFDDSEQWRVSQRDSRQVSCGKCIGGTRLRIVDHDSRKPLPEGETGEIEIAAESLADGYWKRAEASAEAFRDGWLRSGDLGFVEEGNLYVVGRIKDLIVVDGVNVSPEDIEAVAISVEPKLVAVGAFPVDTGRGEGTGLAIELGGLAKDDQAEFCAGLRVAMASRGEYAVQRVLLVRPGLLPRTTSGKIQRHGIREAFEQGRLPVVFDDGASSLPDEVDGNLTVRESLMEAVGEVTGHAGLRPGDSLSTLDISSIDATRIIAHLRASTGVAIDHSDFFDVADFQSLADRIEKRQPAAPLEEIVPGSGRESGRISHSQERMAFLHRLEPESAAYHVFGALEMRGPLDVEALEKAYQHFLVCHPILRTRSIEKDGQALMSFDSPTSPIERRSGEVTVELADFARRPFDLASESPIRLCLIATGPERHVLGLCAHHVVADGWSARVFVSQLAASYEIYRSGKVPDVFAMGPDFVDYAAWQRKRIDDGAADEQIAYWKEHLKGHDGKLELVTDFSRPPTVGSNGSAVLRDLPGEIEVAIAELARKCRATPFMVRFAAWLMLLRSHGGGNDLVSAVPVANRHHAIAGDLVGTLVNTLPLRVTLDEGESFTDLIERVRSASFGMQANQEAPFEKIIEALRPERARDRAPIAQVMFDHQELPMPRSWGGGLECTPMLIHRGAVQFDLSLVSVRLPDRTQLVFEYRSDLFREETVRAMLDRYLALLRTACRAPETAVGRLGVLSENDGRQLEDFANGPERPGFLEKTTLEMVAERVLRHPGRSAFVTPEASLSYEDLASRSDALAAGLRSEGVKRGDRVALLLDRTLDLPCALLAIWKCGAAYLPLDPSNPASRLSLILEDQQAIRVLVSAEYKDRVPEGIDVIELEASLFDHPAGENESPDLGDPAYILYTSGSTGKPKGVVIPHVALSNFLLSMAETPGFSEGEKLLAVTTVSFDISGLELFLPLVCGGTVDLVSSQTARDAAALRKRLETADPEVMQATPATWRMLIDAGWQGSSKLRILCGGEAIDLPLARKLRPLGAELWNMYGPTETTIWSTVWPVPADPEGITIGRPIANTSIRILDSADLPTPPGMPGELLIGGDGLAIGYWKREELTAERFVVIGGERLYRTGDLAKWLPNGEIECLGRTDDQVKLRGFRIELGEIDNAILSHPEVEEAATILIGDRLAGYFRSSSGVGIRVLNDHLKALLPDYMVPALLIPIDVFPLTASGKIDRRDLASRALPMAETGGGPEAMDPLVHDLTRLWARVLKVDQVAPDDDFFNLGGHSLLAARLATAASRETGLQIPLDWLFDRPTPAGMAERLRSDAAADLARPRAIPLSKGGGGNPLFWVHTLVDGGMGLLPYRETAAMLSDVTDSYGIAEGTKTFDSLTEIAAAHVKSIRSVQPQGPYRLAGFCFGGNVAAEIASQLTDAGETVELLALLESSPPRAGVRRGWWLRLGNWLHIFERLPSRIGSLIRRDGTSFLRRLKMKQRAASSKVEQLVKKDEFIPDLHGVLDLEVLDDDSRERAIRHWEALHRHEARLPNAERLVLIRAFDEGWLPRDPNLGWKPPTPFEIYTVSGRHEEFLRNHSAKEVATVLRGLFSRKRDQG
ncbi:amino acid adenylation domain-containing protein [Haloferula sp.]|uniref:amino acid adenylation domain-containing protein n=1 Tax=Haloferula sp. TaxID=2497595 RepID=UPI003C78904F